MEFKTQHTKKKWEESVLVCAQKSRDRRAHNIAEYTKNPKRCLECECALPYDEHKRKRFCNRSCAASFTNKGKPKLHVEKRSCLVCNKVVGKNASKFCCRKHQHVYENMLVIRAWKNGEISGNIGERSISLSYVIRQHLLKENNYKCSKCGWGEKNPSTQKIPLQIHHKNGDCRDSAPSNLEVLCPNCHSLTNTFGRTNKLGRRKLGFRS